MSQKIYILAFFLFHVSAFSQTTWIRINQAGYLPDAKKVAVMVSKENSQSPNFSLRDAFTKEIVLRSVPIRFYGSYGPFSQTGRLDFSQLTIPGSYYIEGKDVQSPVFRIDYDVYNGAADFTLQYLRQQRCGYNPFLNDSCHTHDGFIVYHPDLEGQRIDVVGGWHDASDYLQYVATSANTVFRLLFAYFNNPDVFTDHVDANGQPGSNGLPDILDEAKWGLNWLVKMNPSPDLMFNQIADDRDHAGFRLPDQDTVSYGKGLERPVYFVSGKPQGLLNFKNRTNGTASTAGKFASAFAFASMVFEDFDPEFAKLLARKAVPAYQYGLQKPGVQQTAPCRAPYFYEEDNFVDDMELAAVMLYRLSGNPKYLHDAVNFGRQEPVTPWMGADSARHYQWYPFTNSGHYFLALSHDSAVRVEFQKYLQKGLKRVYERGKNNPFLIGIPFIWCSDNLAAETLMQCDLYFRLTGDTTFNEMESALRDWLLGCNPWGTSMIVGYPEHGNYPRFPHSAFTYLYQYKINGGLVDGPVYGSIFKQLKGLTLFRPDSYAPFQSDLAVYHDDFGDYSTNEPTLDGTASLTYYLAALQQKARQIFPFKNFVFDEGGIIRTDTTKKIVQLAFTAHEYDDGGSVILKILRKHGIKANFFFTGTFLRKTSHENLIKELIREGHYVGPHSDVHPLYADWQNRDSTLIQKDLFLTDLRNNYLALAKYGLAKQQARFFMPPYEWFNREIVNWCKEIGVTLVNFSPGTFSNADYTTPDMGVKYYSSALILKKILQFEKQHGLNGFILLMHLGTHPKRTDKFYLYLNELITKLENRGYIFATLNETIP